LIVVVCIDYFLPVSTYLTHFLIYQNTGSGNKLNIFGVTVKLRFWMIFTCTTNLV